MALGGTAQADSVGCSIPTGFCVNADGINLTQFANANDVSTSVTSLTNSLTAVTNSVTTLNTSVTTINGSVTSINTSLATLNGSVTTLNNSVTLLQAQFGSQARSISKLYDLVAISAALQDAIPNPGDRFAMRLNFAGYQGTFAGSLGGSLNINDALRFSLNYGQGKNQQIFSGGLNFSFN